MPSTAAASRSSRARTAPRFPSGTSAGSLIEPASPCDAHSRITLAPASASRASVPPQASDSSSGCAKMPSTVRPARESRLSATVGLRDLGVDGHIIVDHACRAEPGDGALVHATAIEIEDPRQIVGHLLEIVENHSGDAFFDDLSNGAAIEGGDRRAAGHRLRQDEAERLARLNRVEQRTRAAEQLHLRLKISFPVEDDAAAV